MKKNTIWVRERFHEQREFPERTLRLRLKRGTIVEELDWERKTEKVTIYRRLILKKYKWLPAKTDTKSKILYLTFEKENLEKAKKIKMGIIARILAKQYPMLSYSLFSSLIDSTVLKTDLHYEGAQRMAKFINREMKKITKKTKIIEKEKGAKL